MNCIDPRDRRERVVDAHFSFSKTCGKHTLFWQNSSLKPSINDIPELNYKNVRAV